MDLKFEIISRLASGSLTKPDLLLKDEKTNFVPDRVRRKIAASKRFRLHSEMLVGPDGTEVSAVAWWKKAIAVQLCGQTYRIFLLVIQRQEGRYYYGIPAEISLKSLPNLPFSSDEMKLLLSVADEVSGDVKKKEKLVRIDHPAESTIAHQREYWIAQPYSPEDLFSAISKTALNLEIISVAVDAQWSAIGNFKELPAGITAFVGNSQGDAGVEYIKALLQAVNFSTEPGRFLSGPIVLRDLRSDDQNAYPDRMSLAFETMPGKRNYSSAIGDAIAEADCRELSGGSYGFRPVSTPILISKSEIPSQYVVNVPIPAGLEPLEPRELDLIRAAVSRLIDTKLYLDCQQRWKTAMSQPAAYRVNGFQTWRTIVKLSLIRQLFGGTSLYNDAQQLAVNGTGSLEAQNAEIIKNILDFYQQPELYIKKLPKKDDLKDLPVKASAGFVHTFLRGKNKDRHIIAFTDENALIEIFGEAGLTEGLVQEFFTRLKGLGLTLYDADNRQTLKVDIGGNKLDCFVLLDPRYHSGS